MQSKALEDKKLKAADRRSQEVLLTVQRFTRKNATGEPAGADSSVTGRMSSGDPPVPAGIFVAKGSSDL